MAAPIIYVSNIESFTEGDSGALLSPAVTLSDADSAVLTGATISIADLRTGDYLAFTAQNGITGVFDPLTGVLTLSGSATVAQYEAALESIQFMHAGDANFGHSDNNRTFNWRVTDGVEVSNTGVTVMSISEAGPTAGDDVISNGTPIDDFIDGLAGNDQLFGGGGDDYLRGGLGNDYMDGGTGNDLYVVDSLGDMADETGGDGIDIVMSYLSWTLGTGLENLTLGASGGAINGDGNELDNIITGNYAKNTLQGREGDDTLLGDGGNDNLLGGTGADLLDGGSQNDLLEGQDGDDQLFGGAGNDQLEGGAGADALHGGLGDDLYSVDADDTVVELAGEGLDSVLAGFDYVLGDNIEQLGLTGTDDINGTGNGLRNVIVGNDGANVLHGGGGSDTLLGNNGDDVLFGEDDNDVLSGGDGIDVLSGGDGNDTLAGGAGDDVLDGGAGSDRITGGSGADVFQFNAGTEVATERILDLNFAEGDTIDLGAVYGGTIAFARRFDGQAGQAVLTYIAKTDTTYVRIDLDGDRRFDATLVIDGDHRGSETNLYEGAGDINGGWIL